MEYAFGAAFFFAWSITCARRSSYHHGADLANLARISIAFLAIGAVVVAVAFPAILVVFGHARIRQRLHAFEGARPLRMLEREQAHELVAARVVHLVEFVSRAELGPDRVPQQLHCFDAFLVVDSVRAAHVPCVGPTAAAIVPPIVGSAAAAGRAPTVETTPSKHAAISERIRPA